MRTNYQNHKVLVRVDFNVPMTSDHKVSDNTRIVKAMPTLKHILNNGGSLILMSHLGRPTKSLDANGNIDVEKFTLKYMIPELENQFGREVEWAPDCLGEEAKQKAAALKPGEILLIENLRFYKEEEKGDEEFAKKLAALGTYFVFDAFGTAHRKHASTFFVSTLFDKDHKELGFLVDEEYQSANKLLNNPSRPYTSIIGGAKVSDKIKLLDKLIGVSDNILIGGGMAYTFIKAMGGEIGNSLFEPDYVQTARDILENAKAKGIKFLLPVDSVISDKFSNDGDAKVVKSNEVPAEWMALDIGPEAIKTYSDVIENSKSIMWNGPLGVFEMEKFSKGTFETAKSIANATDKGAFSMIGGGDSVSAINKSGLSERVSFISTGGGAMLEFLENGGLPCIDIIFE
jgi:phosphoglycerate kinase